jgi:hypothetical protein
MARRFTPRAGYKSFRNHRGWLALATHGSVRQRIDGSSEKLDANGVQLFHEAVTFDHIESGEV